MKRKSNLEWIAVIDGERGKGMSVNYVVQGRLFECLNEKRMDVRTGKNVKEVIEDSSTAPFVA